MTTPTDLAKARRWAIVIAGEHQRPAYIYQTRDALIVICLVERDVTIDGEPLEFLEVVQP